MSRLFVAALALAALPALADEGPKPERVELLIKVLRDNGCQMSNEDAPKILPQHGFVKDESRAIAMLLIEDGRARRVPEIRGIALSDETCKG